MKALLRRLYLGAVGAALAGLGALDWIARGGRTRRYDPAHVRRVLVIRLGLLGDGTALLAPALHRLKAVLPQAEVHVLATPLQAPLLEALPDVDRVIVWPAGDLLEPRLALRPAAWREAAATLAALRALRYDVALSCYGRLASAIALLSGAPHRIGFAAEAFAGTLTRALPGGRYDRPWHEARYSIAVAEAAGVPGEEPLSAAGAVTLSRDEPRPPGRLVVPPGARPAGARLLAAPAGRYQGDARRRDGATGEAGGRQPLAVIHLGATNGAAKRWPIPHWAVLVEGLVKRGVRVAIVGGPEDRPLAAALQEQASAPVLDLAGRTTVAELAAVLEQADVVVGGDSGPMHVANALGRPVVAIYGPTDPQISGPYSQERAIVLRATLPCSPCYRLDRVASCPLGHTLCQWLVRPETVLAAAGEALAAQATHDPELTA